MMQSSYLLDVILNKTLFLPGFYTPFICRIQFVCCQEEIGILLCSYSISSKLHCLDGGARGKAITGNGAFSQ